MKTTKIKLLYFLILTILLLITLFISANSGSIKASFSELALGIFNNQYPNVNAIIDVRFPRIIIAILVGAAVAVSGLLLQTSLKNPLIDPSIVGVSSGASLFFYLGLAILPNYNNFKSLFSIIGGIFGFILIYLLANNTKSNIKIILIGIAISSFFSGILNIIQYLRTANNTIGTKFTLNTALGMKSWEDVYLLLYWIPLLLIISFSLARVCNLFVLNDNTLNSLGVSIVTLRIIISLVAVSLASIATSVAGVIVFLALITPHISKIIIGQNHIFTIPFCALLGGFILLFFDTIGRLIAAPAEIPADILMMIFGAPCFIILIKKGVKYD